MPLVLKTPDQVEQMVLADLKRDYTDEQLDGRRQGRLDAGAFPPGMDLKAESMKLLKSQIAGFYDPHEKQMVLVEGADDRYRLHRSDAGIRRSARPDQ